MLSAVISSVMGKAQSRLSLSWPTIVLDMPVTIMEGFCYPIPFEVR